MIIKSLSISLRRIDTDPRTTTNEEVPFIACSVPMNLTDCSWFDCNEGGGKHTRNWEYSWIDDFHAPTFSVYIVRSFGGMIGVRCVERNNPRLSNHILLADVWWRFGTWENE